MAILEAEEVEEQIEIWGTAVEVYMDTGMDTDKVVGEQELVGLVLLVHSLVELTLFESDVVVVGVLRFFFCVV